VSTWFPIPDSLLYENEEWNRLTSTAKVMLLACISEGNRRNGYFHRSNDDWRVRLSGPDKPIALHTFLSARNAICQGRWIRFTPGRRAGHRSVATEYQVYGNFWSPGNIEGHWAQMPRYMFEQILHKMGRDAALAYTYLAVAYWRYRDRYQDRKQFTVELGELKEDSGLRNFYPLIQKLYSGWTYRDKSHLFQFSGCRRIIFTDWNPTSEEVNAEIEAMREKEIHARAERLLSERSYVEMRT
jgi:hypothetical protein